MTRERLASIANYLAYTSKCSLALCLARDGVLSLPIRVALGWIYNMPSLERRVACVTSCRLAWEWHASRVKLDLQYANASASRHVV